MSDSWVPVNSTCFSLPSFDRVGNYKRSKSVHESILLLSMEAEWKAQLVVKTKGPPNTGSGSGSGSGPGWRMVVSSGQSLHLLRSEGILELRNGAPPGRQEAALLRGNWLLKNSVPFNDCVNIKTHKLLPLQIDTLCLNSSSEGPTLSPANTDTSEYTG